MPLFQKRLEPLFSVFAIPADINRHFFKVQGLSKIHSAKILKASLCKGEGSKAIEFKAQIPKLGYYDNDPDWLLSRGALTAALEAAMEGKIRHLGFTGHKHPDIHRKMLNLLEWNWDSTQMPINVCDFHFRSFHSLLQPCAEHGVATIGMKSLGGRADDGSGVLLRTGITAEECIRYSLSQAITTLIVGISNRDELYQALNIGIDFSPMSSQEQADLRDRVREMAADGRFELFKTTQKFDGDYHRAQHDF